MKLTEKKRKSIIAAAIKVFQKQGFRGATTSQIAKMARVSSRTLYNHFGSKEVLFEAISEIMINRKAAITAEPYDPTRDLDVQLAEVIDQYIDILTEPETIALTRMVTAEMLIDLERSRAYFTQMASYQNPITQLISEAMEAGVIRKASPEYATKQLTGLVREFFYTPQLMLGQKLDNDGVMLDCIKMFLSHYKIKEQ